jgi:hypothetical protein
MNIATEGLLIFGSIAAIGTIAAFWVGAAIHWASSDEGAGNSYARLEASAAGSHPEGARRPRAAHPGRFSSPSSS